MKEERLNEKAEMCADKIDDGLRTARQCAILAYKQGVKDSTGLIWNDISELPQKSRSLCLMTSKKKRLKLYCYTDEEAYRRFIKANNIILWAYKEDITTINN